MAKVIVVGAGLAGASAARLLADQGHEVTVLEERSHIAGNCYDEKGPEGITVHRYGPHIFHSKDRRAWDFVQRFSRFRLFQHRVKAYAEGQFLPFPINRDTLCQLYGVELSTSDVKDFLAAEVATSSYHTPPQNFRDAIVAQVGEHLYDCFFRNYTAKQWQRDPAELDASLAGRIPVRSNRDDRYFSDPYQGIPGEGYTAMVEAMLHDPHIQVYLNTAFQPGENPDCDLLVYTGRLDRFFDERFGALGFRSVRFDFQSLDCELYQDVAVVNYPNDYAFTRITEFKHMTGEKSPRTVICYEYPEAEGVPCYVLPDAQNQALRARYWEEATALEAAGHTLFLGRLAEYRYYNMDQVILAAMEKLEKVLPRLAAL